MILCARFIGFPEIVPWGIVAPGSTPFYIGSLRTGPYGNSVPVPGSSISSMMITICNTQTNLIINNRNSVDFFAAGGTVDNYGLLTFPLTVGDTSLADTPSLVKVMRSMIYTGIYNATRSKFRFERRFIVRELSDGLQT